MKRSTLILSVLFYGGCALAFCLSVSHILPPESEPGYIPALKYFRTVTVDVDIVSNIEPPLSGYYGHSKKEIDDSALRLVTNEINDRFGSKRIPTTGHATPGIFNEHPLNLAIVFHLIEKSRDPLQFNLSVTITRTAFFNALDASLGASPQKDYYKNAIVTGTVDRYAFPLIRRVFTGKGTPGNISVGNFEDLINGLSAYSGAIVSKMQPELNVAIEAENFSRH